MGEIMNPLRLRIFCAGLWFSTAGAVIKVDLILSLMGVGDTGRHLFGITFSDLSNHFVLIGATLMFAGLTYPKDKWK